MQVTTDNNWFGYCVNQGFTGTRSAISWLKQKLTRSKPNQLSLGISRPRKPGPKYLTFEGYSFSGMCYTNYVTHRPQGYFVDAKQMEAMFPSLAAGRQREKRSFWIREDYLYHKPDYLVFVEGKEGKDWGIVGKDYYT